MLAQAVALLLSLYCGVIAACIAAEVTAMVQEEASEKDEGTLQRPRQSLNLGAVLMLPRTRLVLLPFKQTAIQ